MLSRAERALIDSNISVAPPKRHRDAASTIPPAPAQDLSQARRDGSDIEPEVPVTAEHTAEDDANATSSSSDESAVRQIGVMEESGEDGEDDGKVVKEGSAGVKEADSAAADDDSDEAMDATDERAKGLVETADAGDGGDMLEGIAPV